MTIAEVSEPSRVALKLDFIKPFEAHNDVEFDDPVGADHDFLGAGLRKALYNYMLGIGLDADVRAWFEAPRPARRTHGRRPRRHGPLVPKTTVPPNLIARSLGE